MLTRPVLTAFLVISILCTAIAQQPQSTPPPMPAATQKPAPTDVDSQDVLRLELGKDMAPGNYVLQVIVTDLSDKQKPRIATQWIDFEIVK